MYKFALIVAASLVSGCAMTGERSAEIAELREARSNPALLNCPGNRPPVCDNWTGSRIRKRLVNCRCWRGVSNGSLN